MQNSQNSEIKRLLDLYGVYNYTIKQDGTVDVDSSVFLINLSSCNPRLDFDELPINFGHINGSINFYHCKNLKSLKGMPKSVSGNMFMFGCKKLTSLCGFKTQVDQTLYCNWKKIKSGGIGIIPSGTAGLSRGEGEADPAFDIIRTYISRPDDIFECQAELIDAGFAEYAQL